jgi:hypothetical protein
MKIPTLAATLGALLVTMLIGVGTAIAQAPKENVSKGLHPNIARAQLQSHNAYESVIAAQRANEFDLGGHAQKAKELLEQANSELKLAAEQSNANKKKKQ